MSMRSQGLAWMGTGGVAPGRALLLGVGLPGAAVVLAALLEPVLDTTTALPVLAALLLAVWFGGPAVGALALLIALLGLGWLFLLEPPPGLALGELLRLGFVGGIGAGAVAAGHRLRHAEFTARTPARERERERERDVGERLQVREEVRRGEARLGGIIDSAMDAIISVDEAQRVVLFNRAAEEVFGLPAAQAIGRPLDDFIPPRYREQHRRDVEAFGRTGETMRTMHTPARAAGLRADGREFPIEATISQFPTERGRLYTVILRDVSERARAEEALEKSNQRMAMALRTSSMVLFTQDLELRYTWIMNAGIDLPPEQFLGRRTADIFERPEDAEALDAVKRDALAAGRLVRREVSVVDRGRAITFDMAAEPLRDAEGRPVGVLCAAIDVTDRARREELLRHAQKLESVGQLAGGIAHDFNNLLTGILGNASLAKITARSGGDVTPLLDDVIRASQRAADLTRQLLAYAGKGKFYLETLDLCTLVPELGRLVHASIPRLVTLDFAVQPGCPPVEADRSQLQQVLMNLVVNAAEAIGERAGTVRVEVVPTRLAPDDVAGPLAEFGIAPGEYVRLGVIDDGAGMDADTRARIFDPFFTTKFMGRGLGLAAVLGIVRGHGGAIQVDSAPGEGTTVHVWLPVSTSGRHDRAAVPPAEEPRGAGTVLLVEDEADVLAMATRALELFGYRVIAAVNGREAVDRCRAHAAEIDVVVLDMVMPVMSGEEAARHLKTIRPDLRIIVTSGYGDVEALRRFAGTRVSDFLEKPYTADRLAAKVQAVIQGRTTVVR